MSERKENLSSASSSNSMPPSYDQTVKSMENESYIKLEFSSKKSLVKLSSLTDFKENTRTPIDLISVLDISGSMNTLVSGCLESSGYRRIDLVVHAMKVIVENLSECDHLTIITFGSDAKVLLARHAMTPENVKLVHKTIDKIICNGMTNLYDGIKTAYSYSRRNPLMQDSKQFINRHIMVLTDGCPNIDPVSGNMAEDKNLYFNLMNEEFERNSSTRHSLLHIFGVCYDQLNDMLLSDIAHHGHGMYGFISDPTIITPCFINIVAIWFNMFVTGLVLKTKHGQVEHSTFIPWILQKGTVDVLLPHYGSDTQFKLVSNKERVMRLMTINSSDGNFSTYYELRQDIAKQLLNISNRKKVSRSEMNRILKNVLASCVQIQSLQEGWTSEAKEWFSKLIYDIDIDHRIKSDALELWAPYCLHSLAVSLRDDYVSNGYEKSYKNKTGLRLQHWIETIEDVAKNIVPPNPPVKAYQGDGGFRSNYSVAAPPAYSSYSSSNSSSYSSGYSDYFSSGSGRDYDDGCIDGNCLVEMADGTSKFVKDVCIGDLVVTDSDKGVGTIRCSLLVPTDKFIELPNGLRITHMHPIWSEVNNDWIFPYNHELQKPISLEKSIDMYSFILEKQSTENERSCAMKINETWVVHFSHNSEHKVLKHDFYGSEKLRETVEYIDKDRKGRIFVKNALRNNEDLVYDYQGYSY